MDFAAYASRAFPLPRIDMPSDGLRKLGRLLDRGMSMTEIGKTYARELGGTFPRDYVLSREIWRDYLGWRQSVRDASSRRTTSELQLLPEDALRTTWSPLGIAVLEAIDEAFPLEQCGSHAVWRKVLAHGAKTWQNALTTWLDQGEVIVTSEGGDETRRALKDTTPVQWLTAICQEQSDESQVRVVLENADEDPILGNLDGTGDEDLNSRAETIADLIRERMEAGVRYAMTRSAGIHALLDSDDRVSGTARSGSRGLAARLVR